MNNTERKLDEARYFLEQLNVNEPYFDYILNAYLSASRSILWIMRHEYSKVSGWNDWYEKESFRVDELNAIEKITELRNKSIKTIGTKTKYYFMDYIVPDDDAYTSIKTVMNWPEGTEFEFSISDEIESLDGKENENDHHVVKFKGRVEFTKDTSDMSRENLILLCKEYYQTMKRIVTLCNKLFDVNNH